MAASTKWRITQVHLIPMLMGLNKQNTIYYAKLKSKMAAATKCLITIFYQSHQYGYQMKGLHKQKTVSNSSGAQQGQGLPGLRDCSKELPRPWYIKGLRRNKTVLIQESGTPSPLLTHSRRGHVMFFGVVKKKSIWKGYVLRNQIVINCQVRDRVIMMH